MRANPNYHKKRGAPVGNTNAVKHGFYARQFKPTDLQDLKKTKLLSVQDEIAMIRIEIRRLVEKHAEAETFEQSLEFVRVISLATLCLTRLIKTEFLVAPSRASEWDDYINGCIRETLPALRAGFLGKTPEDYKNYLAESKPPKGAQSPQEPQPPE